MVKVAIRSIIPSAQRFILSFLMMPTSILKHVTSDSPFGLIFLHPLGSEHGLSPKLYKGPETRYGTSASAHGSFLLDYPFLFLSIPIPFSYTFLIFYYSYGCKT
ncbi:Uncharacterized protein TCM_001148 [Theobroma cacao]|uniref:Uncharacterized protein n=1 Tax=Theobroma cacao TaxID=3641 RepID=A0A061DIT3_THECC|nr:Uncharacterized protein TCM_001148 [Theobroma cacao]